jgi:alpha-glucuronidase
VTATSALEPEDGYRLWLRYARASTARLDDYRRLASHVVVEGASATLARVREELERGLGGVLGTRVAVGDQPSMPGFLLCGTPKTSSLVAALGLERELATLGREGFLIRTSPAGTPIIAAESELAVLYGAFHFLRLLQTDQDVSNLNVRSVPRVELRLLNHWDNLDRTIERGYAGFSRWDWQKLPDFVAPDLADYARAAASLGINGAVLTNVNANALVLTREWLVKVAAMAAAFRPYGVRVYLTARFNAPVELGGLATGDPEDPAVARFWREKADEIYALIPDFGGLLVKANSEGQPGPADYGRTHADGANLLADALAPHGGSVFWRAFVYASEVPVDRAKQAYDEFVPLDGRFRENVILQVKNGPVDFQPREPLHPLFGAMPNTPLALELQLTQEYLGFATHLVYLGTLFEECLRTDTHARGPGSTLGRVVDGTLEGHRRSAIAAVANIGTDRNWCGHPFAAANWYAYGRLAWDHTLSAAALAEEWLGMTFTNDPRFVEPARKIMLASRESCVKYMTPLGLHHLMAKDHHHGPGPWVDSEDGRRPDWTSVYFHRADEHGIGFDRGASGSDAVSQYHSPLRERYGDLSTCPEELLLWFHHVPWDHRLKSGRTLWDSLCEKYYEGAADVERMQAAWEELARYVDPARFAHVKALLAIQAREARLWRDACVLYFQTFSKRPLPGGLEPPRETLEHFRAIASRFVPGIGSALT